MATKNVQLSFKDLIFGQTGDDVMGSRLGPILANIFVKYYEKKILEKVICILHYRYVDDVFTKFPSKNYLFSMLNKMHKCISSTVEEKITRKFIC